MFIYIINNNIMALIMEHILNNNLIDRITMPKTHVIVKSYQVNPMYENSQYVQRIIPVYVIKAVYKGRKPPSGRIPHIKRKTHRRLKERLNLHISTSF